MLLLASLVLLEPGIDHLVLALHALRSPVVASASLGHHQRRLLLLVLQRVFVQPTRLRGDESQLVSGGSQGNSKQSSRDSGYKKSGKANEFEHILFDVGHLLLLGHRIVVGDRFRFLAQLLHYLDRLSLLSRLRFGHLLTGAHVYVAQPSSVLLHQVLRHVHRLSEVLRLVVGKPARQILVASRVP